MKLYLLLVLFNLLLYVQCTTTAEDKNVTSERPNVLFIAVDDLRPELGCYGHSQIISPNIDRLAQEGTLFQNAYCQQAVCAPSRNSLMTGLRPDAIGIYDLYTNFRTKVPNVVTLPQHFKQNGYQAETVGKIYHTGHGNYDDTLSWSVPKWLVAPVDYINSGDTVRANGSYPTIDDQKIPWLASTAPDNNFIDTRTTNRALERLGALKDQPFFLAVGYVKPHLPFVAPKKYWDLYDSEDIEIPNLAEPEGMPEVALHQFGELRKYYGIPVEGALSEDQARNMIHGYYACVSHIDAEIGRLLTELDNLGLSDNTVVILWGDHGWKLGEYGSWCKHTNFELDTRVPLIVKPLSFSKAGGQSEALVEFVDIYPSLCELAGLPLPVHLQGDSFVPQMKDPDRKGKIAALSQYPRGKDLGYDRKKEIMGYSIRTQEFRYTRWQHYENPDSVVAIELYNHTSSPVAKSNLAENPAYQDKINELDKLLTDVLVQEDQQLRKGARASR
ncbi:MAG: sulfatase [Bacteroidota bacterium]